MNENINEWKKRELYPAIFARLADIFPAMGFKFSSYRNRWESPYKMDGGKPKTPRGDKTYCDAAHYLICEQGNDRALSLIDFYILHYGGDVAGAVAAMAEKAGLSLPGSATPGRATTPRPMAEPRPTPPAPMVEDQPLRYFAYSQRYIQGDRAQRATATNFYKWLCRYFDPSEVLDVFRMYNIDAKGERVVFWHIDTEGTPRSATLIQYKPDGHRNKAEQQHPDNRPHRDELKEGETRKNTFFGAHLLKDDIKHVCVVESQKTAVFMALLQPSRLWLACGGLQFLAKQIDGGDLDGRKVTIYPDCKAADRWRAVLEPRARNFAALYFNPDIETWTKENAPDMYESGADLADVLTLKIDQERQAAREAPKKPEFETKLKKVANNPYNENTRNFARLTAQNADLLQFLEALDFFPDRVHQATPDGLVLPY